MPPIKVDEGDDNAGNRVALDKFHCAVEGAVELAFTFQHTAQLPGPFGVNAHLLAGHAVQAEARGHLGDALRAFGDDDELHHGHDGKNDKPHHQIIADHKLAEGGNDLAGIGVGQDKPAGAYGQRQPEQGCYEQYGGKGRETQDAINIKRPHEDQHGDNNIQANKKIHQISRK